jgi:hypothetical protein
MGFERSSLPPPALPFPRIARRAVGRSLCSLLAAWFPGGATRSRPWRGGLPLGGPMETSQGKDAGCPAAPGPTTPPSPDWISGVTLGRALTPTGKPVQGFTCVRCCGLTSGFHPTPPRGASRHPSRRAVASGSWLPPVGPIEDFHLQSCAHAWRTAPPSGGPESRPCGIQIREPIRLDGFCWLR